MLLPAAGIAASTDRTLVDVRIAGIAVNNPYLPPSTEQKTNGPLGYAIHLGTFQTELEKAGFRFAAFQGFPRTAAALLALNAKESEVAMTGDSPAVLSRARGDRQRVIYVGRPDADAWVIGRKDGPATLEQLRGHKVGALFGSIFDYYARNVFDTLGIQKNVSYAQLQVSAALPALQRGDLDAYVTAPATAALWQSRYGLPVIAKASTSYPQWQTTSVATTRQDFLDANPSFPQAYWSGLKTGIDAIKRDPKAYLAWEAQVTGLPLDVVQATVRTDFSDIAIAPEGLPALQRLLDFQLRTGAAKAPFVIQDWVAK
jgi:ABC-type nitrate/sulfonate/bicarbonate transport system substrate-binding protein